MYNPSHKRFLLILLLLFPLITLALSSDKNLPAQFISEKANHNFKSGESIFIGNVQMNQGSSRLTGDKITIFRNDKGQIVKFVSIGKRAHYSTVPDNQDKLLDAYADIIEYYPEKDEAILIGNGEIHQGNNSLKGPRIVYNMQQRTLISQTNTNAEGKPTRSVIVINPNELPGKENS